MIIGKSIKGTFRRFPNNNEVALAPRIDICFVKSSICLDYTDENQVLTQRCNIIPICKFYQP